MRAVADGRVLREGALGYDEARAVWNAMIDRRPSAIAGCASADDAAEVIRYGRDRELEIGVRCGGHSVLGLGVPDGGLMIDLTPMNRVVVDPGRRRAGVLQGGALLGALDRAAMEHGLATTAGNVSHTGVGGLTLGGGMGWLARRHGLSCDNVAPYEMVTADGTGCTSTTSPNPSCSGASAAAAELRDRHRVRIPAAPRPRRAHSRRSLLPHRGRAARAPRLADLNAAAPREATFTAWVGEIAASFLRARDRGRPLANVGFVWVGESEPTAELPCAAVARASRRGTGRGALVPGAADDRRHARRHGCVGTGRATTSGRFRTRRSRPTSCAA